jgi:AbrB family looped-hinge helix DNA binding protein
MSHSIVTRKGQTTIPGEIRQSLGIRPGDRLEYAIADDHATIRVHPGAASLGGVLKSNKGRGKSIAQIRKAAAKTARARGRM